MEWGTIITGLITVQTALLLWMMSKMDSDIKSSTADSNAKWMAANARIDQTQSIIMKMLERGQK